MPTKLIWLAACGLCLCLGLAATGCNKSGQAAVGAVDLKAFDAAPPESKEAWDKALDAAKANDYAAVYQTLGELRKQPGLSEVRTQAISAELTLVHAQMTDALQRGDPNARKALKDIREAARNRGR
jgi:hypothetical protein